MTPIDNDKAGCLPKGKGLIIEFVGPTGSGKTTNCFHFTEFFRKQDFDVYTFSDIKEFLYNLELNHRFHIYFKTLFSNGPHLLSYIFLLARHGIYSFDSIYRYAKLCVFNSALHQFVIAREVDVILLDQWVIQGLWSATIFKIESYEKLQEDLKRFYFKTDCELYFDIDEETACERIHARDSGRSRFDKMSYGKKLAELKRHNPYLYRLYEKSDCEKKFKFSTRVSPAQNAEDFFQRLKYSITPEK
ncbi:MAG TPA: hypothetical protein VK616_17070 [Flavitalea sp.]|nr:hypothetical protein [Flavitalea sp.]HTF31458.1 hypothetical protein [Flavitalea sp.]